MTGLDRQRLVCSATGVASSQHDMSRIARIVPVPEQLGRRHKYGLAGSYRTNVDIRYQLQDDIFCALDMN